jgi:hypothetical protein
MCPPTGSWAGAVRTAATPTRDEAENAIFAYIDGWYNTRRIQKGLDDRSPDEYEAAWYATADQASPLAELTNAP